ncbi:MAG: P22 coat protein - protein 5 domain protein [Clostridia bacterium]|nr:P22 coat protein - protein 5 domain protein [Clostridia bacterium]
MATKNFIPTVWSETLLQSLDREYVGVMHCNRDFEGEIRNLGDSVVINSIGRVSVFDYTANTDILDPEELEEELAVTLNIDRAKAFCFQIDDVDRIQAKPDLMKTAMKEAACALAEEADRYIYSLYTKCSEGNVITKEGVTSDDMVDLVVRARQLLMEKNVNSNTEVVLEVSPKIAAQILKAKILSGTDNAESLNNGYLGNFVGFEVYVSNNIVKTDGYYHCIARTKRAIAFAEQLKSVEAFRPEKRFADAVKGLHLYGAEVVYPDEMVVLSLSV